MALLRELKVRDALFTAAAWKDIAQVLQVL